MSDLDFLVGETVVEVRDDHRVVFEAGADQDPRLYADVASFRCTDGEGTPMSLAGLAGRRVASVSTSRGVLLLAFGDGATLRCDPGEEFEAWQVVGGKPEHLVVCCPGGELAVWNERTPTIRLRPGDPAGWHLLDEMLERFNMPQPSGYPPPEDEQA